MRAPGAGPSLHASMIADIDAGRPDASDLDRLTVAMALAEGLRQLGEELVRHGLLRRPRRR